MTHISIAELAGAVLARLPRDAVPAADFAQPTTHARPRAGAALVLDHPTGIVRIAPVLVSDFYEGRAC